jgi:hypothetical protein
MDGMVEREILGRVTAAQPLTVASDLFTVLEGALVTEASDLGIRAGDRWPTTIIVRTPGGDLKFIRGSQIRHGHGEDEEFGGYVYELLDGVTRVIGQQLRVFND